MTLEAKYLELSGRMKKLELENEKLKTELLLETDLRKAAERDLDEADIDRMRLEDWVRRQELIL